MGHGMKLYKSPNPKCRDYQKDPLLHSPLSTTKSPGFRSQGFELGKRAERMDGFGVVGLRGFEYWGLNSIIIYYSTA